MSAKKTHEATAKRIAKKLDAEYNKGKGPDVITSKIVVEVETPRSINEGLSQLQGFKKPVYIAATNESALQKALEKTKKTTVGVMDPYGKIVKKSTRRK